MPGPNDFERITVIVDNLVELAQKLEELGKESVLEAYHFVKPTEIHAIVKVLKKL